jgi:hypothetical protein
MGLTWPLMLAIFLASFIAGGVGALILWPRAEASKPKGEKRRLKREPRELADRQATPSMTWLYERATTT